MSTQDNTQDQIPTSAELTSRYGDPDPASRTHKALDIEDIKEFDRVVEDVVVKTIEEEKKSLIKSLIKSLYKLFMR